MTGCILVNGTAYTLDPAWPTVLHALRDLGVAFAAPCGGNGTCGKCSVWVRDADGLRRELACSVAPADGMAIHVEKARAFRIADSCDPHGYACDVKESNANEREGVYGLAIDVGTTTLAMRLHRLDVGEIVATASRPNPQISFGADVVSRISASMEGALPAMTALVWEALDSMANALCAQASIPRTCITHAALAGNTVMESIAANVSPDSIGVHPFEPISYFGNTLNIPAIAPHVHFAPCLSGYVGGDITAGLLAAGLGTDIDNPVSLLVDLGTNGEIALCSGSRIITCATAAGPVFEGANIAFGMPAQTGAISQVRLDSGSENRSGNIHIDTIDGEPVFGICGTGLIDAVATLLDAGIIDETGRMLDAEEARAIPGMPEELADRLSHSEQHGVSFRLADGVLLTQADVRAVQLAKAAICAGILTALDTLGAKPADVKELQIAGGFGHCLRAESAARIGLFPPELASCARAIGNASLEGASALLISACARTDARGIRQRAEYIELSTSSTFNMRYLDCMEFE